MKRITLIGLMLVVLAVLCCVYSCRDRDAVMLGYAMDGDTNALAMSLRTETNISRLFHYRCRASVSLLHVAVEFGQLETVEFLLQKRADPNTRDADGRTPVDWVIGLTEAELETREKILGLLLRAGANLNLADGRDFTPLMFASYCGQSDMAKILIESGANVNLINQDGCSPLHIAMTPEIATVLLKAGADLHAKTRDGQTPIETAIRSRNFRVVGVLTNEINRTGNQ